MSAFDRPKPVWISPAMIGEKPRKRKEFKVEDPRPSGGIIRPLNPRALSFSAGEGPHGVTTSNHDTVNDSTTSELMSEHSETSDAQLSPHMIPLPESDSDEPYTPSSEVLATQEVLALETTGLAAPSTGTSKDWASPTYSDQGISAWVWVSPVIAEYDRWMIVKAHLKTMELIPRSPYVPRTFSEWLIHRAEMTDIKAKELRRRVDCRELIADPGPTWPRVEPVFRGDTFEDADNGVSRSGVGAEETFWSLWLKPSQDRPRADWPCQAEMREEGDERNTSGFGRFPALPRVNGNETVNYKHKRVIAATPLDTVWPPPNSMGDQETQELDDDYARLLVGKDLAAALDAD